LNRSDSVALVSVRSNYRVVIPQSFREKMGLNVGDLLEARAERGRITFTRKAAADSGIAESFADFNEGRTYGPFQTHEELLRSLHDQRIMLGSKRRSRRARRT